MLFSILIALLIVVALGVAVYEYVDSGNDASWVVGAVSATLCIGTLVGGLLLLAIGTTINLNRDDEGWALEKESVYTVAEDSGVHVENGVIEFVAVMDGAPHAATVSSGQRTYVQTTEGPRTITVREEFRDVGTAIFPWGEGDHKITSFIK